MRLHHFVCFFFFCFAVTNCAQALPIELLKLPPGYKIEVYAEGVSGARQLAVGDKGTVFVGSRRESVFAIVKNLGQTRIFTIASGLNQPNGVAFHNGALYVAEIDRILRYDDIENRLTNPPAPVVVRDDLPDDTWHGMRYIGFGYDDKLYVGIGMPCNSCLPTAPVFGTIARMDADGSNFEIYAKGIRNTVGFDWDQYTKQLWFTDNGRDNLGDNTPPDKLNFAPNKDMNFGFPYYNGKGLPDPVYGAQFPESNFTMPTFELPAHVASLGMKFYKGNAFPKLKREGAKQVFIALHGSWNRSSKIGYQVIRVWLCGNTVFKSEPFITGWLQGQNAWGRPVDIAELKDGSLLVSDDTANAIYRVTFG